MQAQQCEEQLHEYLKEEHCLAVDLYFAIREQVNPTPSRSLPATNAEAMQISMSDQDESNALRKC